MLGKLLAEMNTTVYTENGKKYLCDCSHSSSMDPPAYWNQPPGSGELVELLSMELIILEALFLLLFTRKSYMIFLILISYIEFTLNYSKPKQ